jgi:hypothetical protein
MNDTAANLARDGKWNDIFNGTVFNMYGIVWNSGNQPTSGINTMSSKWIMSTSLEGTNIDGYRWVSSQNAHTQMLGHNSLVDNNIAFGPYNSNPNNLLASWKYNDVFGMFDWSHNIIEPSVHWDVSIVSSQVGLLVIDMHIAPPTVQTSNGTIITFEQSSCPTYVGIQIMSAGPKLLTAHCSNSVYSMSSSCETWCTSNPLLCSTAQKQICSNIDNLPSEFCKSYCSQAFSNCDERYNKLCSIKLQEVHNSVETFIHGEYADMCACFLPQSTMDSYAANIMNTFGTYVDRVNTKCFYPPCSQNVNSIKPHIWNKGCDNCPVISGCLLNADIDFQGSLSSSPGIYRSSKCKSLGVDEPYISDSLTAPNSCSVASTSKQKVNVKHKTSDNNNSVIMAGLIFTLVLLLGVALSTKLKRRTI